jgi:hypothetical protein
MPRASRASSEFFTYAVVCKKESVFDNFIKNNQSTNKYIWINEHTTVDDIRGVHIDGVVVLEQISPKHRDEEFAQVMSHCLQSRHITNVTVEEEIKSLYNRIEHLKHQRRGKL